MMSPAMKTGLIRVGVLLSVVWVLAVSAVALHEGRDEGKLCGVTDATVSRACHQFFWEWRRPADDDNPAAATQEPKDGKDQSIRLRLGKLSLDLRRDRPLVHRFNPVRFAVGMFGPLVALWGFGFGLAWCMAGFQKKA